MTKEKTQEHPLIAEVQIPEYFMSPQARFNWKTDPPGCDLRELAAYTNDSPKDLIDKCRNARKNLADEWNEKQPKSIQELKKFYTETKGYLYDLWTWTHDKEMWELFDKEVKGTERVLDYGCGNGDAAIYFAEKGCDVVATDLPGSETLQFAMWRVYQRGLGDKIQFKYDHTVDRFDIITAIDVLEHVYYPLRYTVMLGGMLRNRNSWLFVTPTFVDDFGVHPMHLRENFWLKEHFYNAMTSLSFFPHQPIEKYLPLWHPLFKDPPPDQAPPPT